MNHKSFANKKNFHHRHLISEIPESLKPWLLNAGSMTKKMQHHAQQVNVEVIQHHFGLPTLQESQQLKIKNRTASSIREVYMYCNNEPWLFARTVIPLITLQGKMRRLTKLGTIPLGKILFKDLHMKRSDFVFNKLFPDNPMYQRLLPTNKKEEFLWQRESIFWVQQKPLLLIEIFLPAMINYLKRV